ncbi:MAG: hypothetical protein AAGF12_33160 [Myxococcota bacterium]
MRCVLVRLGLIPLALGAPGCNTEATQTIVVIEAEDGVLLPGARAVISVYDGSGTQRSRFSVPQGSAELRTVFPFELPISAIDNDASRGWHLALEIHTADDLVLLRRGVSGGFINGRGFVRVLLTENCRGVYCEGEGRTCRAGICASPCSDSAPTLGDDEIGTCGANVPECLARSIQSVSAGARHVCALDTEGTAFCWGNASEGRLGGGSRDDDSSPPVSILSSPGRQSIEGLCSPLSQDSCVRSDWREVDAGDRHGCGLAGNQTFCWGSNADSRTGQATAELPDVAFNVQQAEHRSLSLGWGHNAAIGGDSRLWLWGDNSLGQLGHGFSGSAAAALGCTSADLFRCKQDVGNAVEGIVSGCAGSGFSCAVDQSGRLLCWGTHDRGQLGIGDQVPQGLFEEVEPEGWTAVVCGESHACGLRNGVVNCWGANDVGQTGAEAGEDVVAPKAVPLPGASYRELAAGADESCALESDGVLRCWGANGNRVIPGSWNSISLGDGFGCGIRADGAAYCFGNNDWGQLGRENSEGVRPVCFPPY